jgi:hypothetical protein
LEEPHEASSKNVCIIVPAMIVFQLYQGINMKKVVTIAKNVVKVSITWL